MALSKEPIDVTFTSEKADGFPVDQFIQKIPSHLVCSICMGVFNNIVEIRHCNHAFCQSCIEDWRERNGTCPTCRQPIHKIRKPSRILCQVIDDLQLRCQYSQQGCDQVLPISDYPKHIADCVHDPTRPVPCRHCEKLVDPKIKEDHCLLVMRKKNEKLVESAEEWRKRRREYKDELDKEMKMFKGDVDILLGEVRMKMVRFDKEKNRLMMLLNDDSIHSEDSDEEVEDSD